MSSELCIDSQWTSLPEYASSNVHFQHSPCSINMVDDEIYLPFDYHDDSLSDGNTDIATSIGIRAVDCTLSATALWASGDVEFVNFAE